MWVYFWAFYPVPLICISVFVSVLHCFDDWICSILWSQGTCFFQLQFSFSRLHCYLGSIVFPYKLKLFFFYLREKNAIGKKSKSWLIGKDSDAGRDWGQEEKGTTEDEMAGWHHRLDGREFDWTQGVGDGQGGLVYWDSWGPKESDTTEQLNWTELNPFLFTSLIY